MESHFFNPRQEEMLNIFIQGLCLSFTNCDVEIVKYISMSLNLCTQNMGTRFVLAISNGFERGAVFNRKKHVTQSPYFMLVYLYRPETLPGQDHVLFITVS